VILGGGFVKQGISGEAVSDKSYARLHKRLQELIAIGKKVANITAGTPEAQIHKWIKEAEECLSLLEDKTALSDFRHIQQRSEFQVDDGDEDSSSLGAYRPSWIDQRTGLMHGADVLLDFRFDQLAKANDILKSAATKLEMEGHSLPTLGEELRAARLRAGHTQQEAAEQIGDTWGHKYVSEWESGKRKPHPNMAKKIRDYIKKTNKP
jgi:DNA-binding transcriptional regulator YiaG